MADLWTHEFCLGCDKQTDGTAYCSESCRLADNDKTSMPGSAASSPGLNSPSYPWLSQQTQPQNGFFLTPAVDFSNPQPFGSSSSSSSYLASGRSTSRTLQQSSSNTSLCSMSTVSSNTEATQLSEKTRQELQSYAASFDNARLARRRSY